VREEVSPKQWATAAAAGNYAHLGRPLAVGLARHAGQQCRTSSLIRIGAPFHRAREECASVNSCLRRSAAAALSWRRCSAQLRAMQKFLLVRGRRSALSAQLATATHKLRAKKWATQTLGAPLSGTRIGWFK